MEAWRHGGIHFEGKRALVLAWPWAWNCSAAQSQADLDQARPAPRGDGIGPWISPSSASVPLCFFPSPPFVAAYGGYRSI